MVNDFIGGFRRDGKIMPRRASTRTNAASKSRYLCTRLASENARRVAAVEKMSPNIAESTAVADAVAVMVFNSRNGRNFVKVIRSLRAKRYTRRKEYGFKLSSA